MVMGLLSSLSRNLLTPGLHREFFTKHPLPQVLETILRVEEYPLFLWGCQCVYLLEGDTIYNPEKTGVLRAEMVLAGGFSFTTTMAWSKDRVDLENPFVRGHWWLIPSGVGTRVGLHLEMKDSGWRGHGLRAMLLPHASSMQRALEHRLQEVYAMEKYSLNNI